MTGRMLGKWTEICMLGSALVVLAGCETNAGRQAKVSRRAVSSLGDTRQQLMDADRQIDAALISMDRLTVQPQNLKRTYKEYASEVSKTDHEVSQLREQADDMRTRWHEYITSWEGEANRLSSEELRAGTTERRQTVREDYDRLRNASTDTYAASEPFLVQLREIRRILSLDLTPAGVEAAKPAMETARQTGAQLKEQIDAFVKELDRVAVSGAATTPEPGSVAGTEP